MTDVTMKPRSNTGSVANESLSENMIRQNQLQRYQKLKRREKQLRREALARQQRIKEKVPVYITRSDGQSRSYEQEEMSYEELGASAEGEVDSPKDLLLNISSKLSILHKGESIDAEEVAAKIDTLEEFVATEENRKIREEASFKKASETATGISNNTVAPHPTNDYYKEQSSGGVDLSQDEIDALVVQAQEGETVEKRRAAMRALQGTTEGKYETPYAGEIANLKRNYADRDKFVVRAQDPELSPEAHRAAMAMMSGTLAGKYETIRAGEKQFQIDDARIQERLAQGPIESTDDYHVRVDSILKIPKSDQPDMSKEAFGREKDVVDRVYGDDKWTSAGGTRKTYQETMGIEPDNIKDEYYLTSQSGRGFTLVFDNSGKWEIRSWYGGYRSSGQSVGESFDALKKEFDRLDVPYDKSAKNVLDPDAAETVFLDPNRHIVDEQRPANLKSKLMGTYYDIDDITDWQEFRDEQEAVKVPQVVSPPNKTEIKDETISAPAEKSDYLKELKSEGALWKVAEKKDFSDLSVAIVGGTEMIQKAGTDFLDKQQAKVDALIRDSFIAPENKEMLFAGTEFTKHFVSFPLMFQSFALAAPATEDVLRSKEVNDVVDVPFVAKSNEKWVDKAEETLPLAIAGITEYAKENPVGFAGDIAGIAVGPKMVKTAGLTAGRGTGIIRSKTFIAKNPTGHPLGSQSAMLESIIEQPSVSGARGTIQTPKQFFNRFLNKEMQWTRSYKEAGGTFGEQAQYTTISPKFKGEVVQERVGSYFIQKGVRTPVDKLFRTRVHIVENIETVASELSPAEKSRIWGHWEKFGEISNDDYRMLVDRAVSKSKRIHQPVIGPTPKLRKGSPKPELEAMLFFGDDAARQITSSKFAGITEDGTIVRKVRYGNQPPVESSSVLAENRIYNTRLTQRRIEAMSVDMNRKIAELSGSAKTKPNQYHPHGSEHLDAVAEEMNVLRAKSETYRKSYTKKEGEVAAFLHDSAKIYGTESEPFDHATATKMAIKRGLIEYDPLTKMSRQSQMKIAKAIGQHSKIKPGVSSKILHRPSRFDEALASADRLSWAKVDGKVKSGKIFTIPEHRTSNLAILELRRMFNKGSSKPVATGRPVATDAMSPFDNKFTPPSKTDVSFPKMPTERTKWPEQHSIITPKKEDAPFNPIENMKTKPSKKPNTRLKNEEAYYPKESSYKRSPVLYNPVASYKNPVSSYKPPKTDGYKPKTDNYDKVISDDYQPKTDGYKPKTGQYKPKTNGYKPKTGQYKPKTDGYKPKTKPYKSPSPQYQPKTDPFKITNTKIDTNRKPRKRKKSDLNIFNMENVEIPIIRGEEALGGKYNPLERPANKRMFAELGSDIFQISKSTGRKLKKKSGKKKKERDFYF